MMILSHSKLVMYHEHTRQHTYRHNKWELHVAKSNGPSHLQVSHDEPTRERVVMFGMSVCARVCLCT